LELIMARRLSGMIYSEFFFAPPPIVSPTVRSIFFNFSSDLFIRESKTYIVLSIVLVD